MLEYRASLFLQHEVGKCSELFECILNVAEQRSVGRCFDDASFASVWKKQMCSILISTVSDSSAKHTAKSALSADDSPYTITVSQTSPKGLQR